MRQVSGTPIMGSLSLAPGSLGPTAFALFTVMGQAAYTLKANERIYVHSIAVSTNDAVLELITVDTGGVTPTKIVSAYLMFGGAFSPISLNWPPGTAHGIFGVVPRGSASAITAAKTVEITMSGIVSKT